MQSHPLALTMTPIAQTPVAMDKPSPPSLDSIEQQFNSSDNYLFEQISDDSITDSQRQEFQPIQPANPIHAASSPEELKSILTCAPNEVTTRIIPVIPAAASFPTTVTGNKPATQHWRPYAPPFNPLIPPPVIQYSHLNRPGQLRPVIQPTGTTQPKPNEPGFNPFFHRPTQTSLVAPSVILPGALQKAQEFEQEFLKLMNNDKNKTRSKN